MNIKPTPHSESVLCKDLHDSQTYTLTSASKNIEVGEWTINNKHIENCSFPFVIEQKTLHGGKQEGTKIITITCPEKGLNITVTPTRGMSVVNARGKDIYFGWDSPVKELVNPVYINLDSRGGTGWTEGFNEMLVRCGFEWTGHPGYENGQLYSLHGRLANTPASEVEISISKQAPYEIKIRGLLKESAFKSLDMHTLTELSYVPGSNHFTIHDILTNHADYPHDYEIIYHNNFSKPLLEENAEFIAPVEEISPFDEYALKELNNWSRYYGPTKDFNEMVYNIKLFAKPDGTTKVALANKMGDKGAAIEFNINQLPRLALWKNTDTEKQGYVTGIEPCTNHAYPIAIEREQGRIKQIAPGQSLHFKMKFSALVDKEAVETTRQEISAIMGNKKTKLIETPIAKE